MDKNTVQTSVHITPEEKQILLDYGRQAAGIHTLSGAIRYVARTLVAPALRRLERGEDAGEPP